VTILLGLECCHQSNGGSKLHLRTWPTGIKTFKALWLLGTLLILPGIQSVLCQQRVAANTPHLLSAKHGQPSAATRFCHHVCVLGLLLFVCPQCEKAAQAVIQFLQGAGCSGSSSSSGSGGDDGRRCGLSCGDIQVVYVKLDHGQ
jgi:hypothetical protein